MGSNYIIDNVKNNVNGEDVNWYLFRIPIREGYKVQGNPAARSRSASSPSASCACT